MRKIRTSIKPKGFVIKSKKKIKLHKFDPTSEIQNLKNFGAAVAECMINNDPKGVIEMINIYLESFSKSEIDLHKSTLYSALSHKNPTLKTLCKILSHAKR